MSIINVHEDTLGEHFGEYLDRIESEGVSYKVTLRSGSEVMIIPARYYCELLNRVEAMKDILDDVESLGLRIAQINNQQRRNHRQPARPPRPDEPTRT